jgi:hypothetical protein
MEFQAMGFKEHALIGSKDFHRIGVAVSFDVTQGGKFSKTFSTSNSLYCEFRLQLSITNYEVVKYVR